MNPKDYNYPSGNAQCASTAPVSIPQVPQQVNEITEAALRIEQVVSRLEERLSTVLRESPCSPPLDKMPEIHRVQLASDLAGSVRNLEASHLRIRSILDRIEL